MEVPHAGLDLPARFLEPLTAPARALGRDADLHVDALYEDAPAEGASLIVARTSRYVIDLNRAEGDVDGEAVEGGRSDVRMQHGLVWRTTSDGEAALARRLRPEELEERLELVWRPYHAFSLGHRAKAGAVRRGRGTRGAFDANCDRPGVPEPERPSAAAWLRTRKIAPGVRAKRDRARRRSGDRGRRSADARFIDVVEEHAASRGWSVRHDDPYAGGFTTQHYGHPAGGVHVVQVELARRLYLDETALRPSGNFASTRAWCRELVARLGNVALIA